MESKIYDLIEKMHLEMQNGFQQVNTRINKLEIELKGDVRRIEQNLARIEHDHGEKFSALFDGYVQNSQKLDRIEREVQKHEEFIIKRVK